MGLKLTTWYWMFKAEALDELVLPHDEIKAPNIAPVIAKISSNRKPLLFFLFISSTLIEINGYAKA